LANARERHGRNESNIGLFEERISEVQKNQALSTKAKMEALEKLVDVIQKYGEVETALKAAQLQNYEYQEMAQQQVEKVEAKRTAEGNKFVQEIMMGLGSQQAQNQ
jgi:S-adenosylmethionine hydrolase